MKKIKRIISVFLAMVMVISAIGFEAIAESLDGVPEGYTGIYTVEDLYNVRKDLTGNYILMNDIDLTEATAPGGEYDFNGNGWNPIGSGDLYGNNAFTGIFDGNGFSVIGMRISISEILDETITDVYVGLFANNAGTIKNLNMLSVSVDLTLSIKNLYTGAIAAYSSGTIDTCNVSGKINGINGTLSTNHRCGGIVGENNGTVLNCFNKIDINMSGYSKLYLGGIIGWNRNNSSPIYYCANSGNVSTFECGSSHYVGGIAGWSEKSVYDCYNSATIKSENSSSASNCVSGIVGYALTTIYRCYNVGNIFYNDEVGKAFRQYYDNSDSCINSYYLEGTSVSVKGIPSKENRMKELEWFVGFDFDTIWAMGVSADDNLYPYPQLRSHSCFAQGHLYEWQYDNEASCNEISIRTKVCIRCGHRKDTEEYVKQHTPELNWTVITEATCTTQGEKVKYCTECNEIAKSVTYYLDHQFGECEVIVYSTEYNTGEQKHFCKVCGYEEIFTTPVVPNGYIPIYTVDDLRKISVNTAKCYILMNDIDLTEYCASKENGWVPIGGYYNPYDKTTTAFTGVFEGNGHTISGLTINVTDSCSYWSIDKTYAQWSY